MQMDDPYRVLGVSPSSSEEEITKAYRSLAKKYHPDLNPGDKTAEQKMRQVNAAYEQIKNQKHGDATYERSDGTYGKGPETHAQGPYGNGGPYGGFGGFEDFFSGFGGYEDSFGGQRAGQGAGSQELRAVIQAINMGQYQRALSLLSHVGNRDAEWYYLSAIANAGLDNRVTALNHAAEAVRMAPGNPKYQSLLSQFQQGSYTYRQSGQSYGFDMSNLGGTLMKLFLAQMLCMCCCRGF